MAEPAARAVLDNVIDLMQASAGLDAAIRRWKPATGPEVELFEKRPVFAALVDSDTAMAVAVRNTYHEALKAACRLGLVMSRWSSETSFLERQRGTPDNTLMDRTGRARNREREGRALA